MEQKQILEENIRYKKAMLYFAEYGARYTSEPFPDVPWHWHRDFELSRVKSGSVIYKSPNKEVVLKAGDAVFVNSKTIHAITPLEPREGIHHISQFFNNSFISGGEGSIIDTKYVIPIQQNENIDMLVMKKDDETFKDVHRLMDENSELLRSSPKYYEFQLKKNAFDIWQTICESIGQAEETNIISSLSNKRLRKAITYLQDNYNKKITLDEVSEVVHISSRECNRMFNKYLKISPINYQLSIRLQKAAAMLADFDKSIGEVAFETGYPSNSYFTTVFKKRYNMTPKEYRLMLEKNK